MAHANLSKPSVHSRITYKAETFWADYRAVDAYANRNSTITPDVVYAGTLVTEWLVTDSIPYRVTKSTEKTITIERLVGDPIGKITDGRQLPVVTEIYGANSETDGRPKTLRLRKDGTYRTGSGMRPLTFGYAVSVTDYKM